MINYNLSAVIEGWQTFTDITCIVNDGAVFIFVIPRETVGNFTGTNAYFYIKFGRGDYTMTYTRNSNMIYTQYTNPPSSAATSYNIFQDRNLVSMMEMSSAYDMLTTYVNGGLKGVNEGYFCCSYHVSATGFQPAASAGTYNATMLVFNEGERAKAKIVAEKLRNVDSWRFVEVANQVMNRVIPPTPPPLPPAPAPIPKLFYYRPV